jgi:SWI/SNF-related matrix-associated actin-dependent regulator 1 of chromatin subfamily A
MREHRFVIANYDILTQQVKKDAAGKREQVAELPGWAEALARAEFDLCIADEAHLLRGRSTLERRGETRRDRLVRAMSNVERFWALTGTPIYGRVSDLWAMLDVVTDGLYGRPFFSFDVRYAGGGRGTYGWVADGCTNETELQARLATFMLKRDRRDIMSHLPPKTRQVVKVESGKASFAKPKGSRTSGGLHAALRATAAIKEARVVESVTQELAEGGKVVVFTYLRENADSMAKALADECQKGTLAPALRARNTRVWSVSGDTSVEARFKQAEAFRNWSGAGVFVATIGSVPVAISLKGAQSVHFADLDFSPAAVLQAEDRPYEVGTNGLAIVYWVVEQSIDEHVVEMVLSKMRTLETVVSEQAAGSFREAFGGQTADELAEEVWKRMEAAA